MPVLHLVTPTSCVLVSMDTKYSRYSTEWSIVGFDHGLLWRVKNVARGTRGLMPRFLSLQRTRGHVFHTVWETMIKSYQSTLTDWFFPRFDHKNMILVPYNWQFVAFSMVTREMVMLLWTGYQETQMILVAMENFQNDTVAMLGGPCS